MQQTIRQKGSDAALSNRDFNLAKDGLIFMGHSETLNGLDVPLVMVHPTIYGRSCR